MSEAAELQGLMQRLIALRARSTPIADAEVVPEGVKEVFLGLVRVLYHEAPNVKGVPLAIEVLEGGAAYLRFRVFCDSDGGNPDVKYWERASWEHDIPSPEEGNGAVWAKTRKALADRDAKALRECYVAAGPNLDDFIDFISDCTGEDYSDILETNDAEKVLDEILARLKKPPK
ncbi:hypothetical protein HPO_12438 [Hyphomonas polymorpha PS728]|uniref:Uncharacterized protein n=1 Tax=Hyphomonas polymorpha PS728 TaxID=1280954 RepID=A0A062VCB0_9PROT|nr:hypothetical protein [Hyphomonas polymorpha]KCZ97872.1 hypothetical protein HPO_12438 [Hyphomonas polymorpha PS728]